MFNADVEIGDDFVAPDSWKVPGSDNVTIEQYPRFKSVRDDVVNDPWGFCHQIIRNLIANNPIPHGGTNAKLPQFPSFSNHGADTAPMVNTTGDFFYKQWINCLIDYEDEDHPTCKKARWYVEEKMLPRRLETLDDARESGDLYSLLIRFKRRPMQAMYTPFSVTRPGAYEWNFALGRTTKSSADLGVVMPTDTPKDEIIARAHLGAAH